MDNNPTMKNSISFENRHYSSMHIMYLSHAFQFRFVWPDIISFYYNVLAAGSLILNSSATKKVVFTEASCLAVWY